MGRITCNPPLRSMLITFLNSFGDVSVDAFVHTCKSCSSFISLGHLGHDSVPADVGVRCRSFAFATSENGLALLATSRVSVGIEVGLSDIYLSRLWSSLLRLLDHGFLDEDPIGVSSFMYRPRRGTDRCYSVAVELLNVRHTHQGFGVTNAVLSWVEKYMLARSRINAKPYTNAPVESRLSNSVLVRATLVACYFTEVDKLQFAR